MIRKLRLPIALLDYRLEMQVMETLFYPILLLPRVGGAVEAKHARGSSLRLARTAMAATLMANSFTNEPRPCYTPPPYSAMIRCGGLMLPVCVGVLAGRWRSSGPRPIGSARCSVAETLARPDRL